MDRRTCCRLFAGLIALPAVVRADDALWSLLQRGGQVVLVRHAVTDPGVGDPEGFRLGACGTQRNLSEEGRREAQRLGESIRARKVRVAQVLASPWCRCVDTARLAFGSAPQTLPALGNLFGRREQEAQQVAELRRRVRAPAAGNAFWVTHGSTTLALTGVSPATAEMVVLTPSADGGFRVAGRIPPG
ncbi:MAG TPA: histidine phosphatase family protein [Ramlibacter sp.]|nr:histidine phosphatase family protein [Ramlibacter sp.]